MKDIRYVSVRDPVFQMPSYYIKSGKGCVSTGEYMNFFVNKMLSCGFTISPFIKISRTISPFQHLVIASFHHVLVSPFHHFIMKIDIYCWICWENFFITPSSCLFLHVILLLTVVRKNPLRYQSLRNKGMPRLRKSIGRFKRGSNKTIGTIQYLKDLQRKHHGRFRYGVTLSGHKLSVQWVVLYCYNTQKNYIFWVFWLKLSKLFIVVFWNVEFRRKTFRKNALMPQIVLTNT